MMDRRDVEKRITNMFQRYLAATRSRARSLVPPTLTAGKLYEAYVLGLVARELTVQESLQLILMGAPYLALKSAPGPINPSYPHVELHRGGSHVANLWTDVEFLSLSYSMQSLGGRPGLGDYHELDLLVTEPSARARPSPTDIWLGVECKNTGYTKALLKEILGIRRELSLLQDPKPTKFSRWPRASIPAQPPVCLLVYSTDPNVSSYSSPGTIFGIDFFHETL